MWRDAKVIAGVAVGLLLALVVGVVSAGAVRGTREGSLFESDAWLNADRVLTGSDAMALGCQPGETAVARRLAVGNEPVTTVRCVSPVALAMGASAPLEGQIPLVAPAMSAARVIPAVTSAPPQVVREVQVPRVETRRNGRPWQKTALIIGGSTAAGAGVGGLVGGKKGALIGAAIGGGASTIYEATKR